MHFAGVDGDVVGGDGEDDGDGDNGDGETASAVPFGFSHFPAVSFVASLSPLCPFVLHPLYSGMYYPF